MKRQNIFAIALALCVGIALSGCASLGVSAGQALISAGQYVSSSTPAQVDNYAKAVNALTLVTLTVDGAVNLRKFDRDTLDKLDALNDICHDAFLKVKAAKDAGQSINYAALNAAIDSFRLYSASKGIPQVTTAPTN